MRKSILILLLAFAGIANGQTVFFVDNETVHIDNNAILWIDGDYQSENAGILNHYGELYVSGDWTNNATNNGFMPNNTGFVDLFSTSPQTIKGTSETHYYDLILNGGNSTKDLDIDAHVLNTLTLNDSELQTDEFNMYVDNAATNAITWVNGFVNSRTLGGHLVRAMNSTGIYSFPVGDRLLSNIYRGVDITPSSNAPTAYGVRLKAINATNDVIGTSYTGVTGGFDLSVKNPNLPVINPNYYHNISRFAGTQPAAVDVYYFSGDGNYFKMAQWQDNTNQWEATSFINSTVAGPASYGYPDKLSRTTGYSDFTHDAFALTEINPITVPEFISPGNGDNLNDILFIENIDLFPGNHMQIFNRYGNIVYETTDYDNTWDGKVNGASKNVFATSDGTLPTGTYYYILDLNNDTEPLHGFFQLKR